MLKSEWVVKSFADEFAKFVAAHPDHTLMAI